mgnify:FL=1
MTKPNAAVSQQSYSGDGSPSDWSDRFGVPYSYTVSAYLQRQNDDEIFQKGDPCSSKGKLGEINTNIQKIFVVLRGIQKYGNFYINAATNAVSNLKSTIYAITGAIAGVLKSLVQRLRNWILNKIKSLISAALEMIMTNFLKTIKESVVSAIVDQIFCSFEKIIKGLFGLVGDFLYSLIGQIIQTPLCAIEQWTNALINRLVDDIDKILAPIFDNINDILGGVGKIFGSVSSAIDMILGFQGFLCGGPECPEIKEFSLSPWGGPTKSEVDNFSNFNFGISPSFAGEITEGANGLLDDFFGEDSNSSQSPGECYTGTFECGLPQVKIFGGGGSGAVADAVVNTVGQVIGTNLISGGSDYTTPPFVQIVDPAGCGSNASGFVIMELDADGYQTGSISEIVIDNPGSDYDNSYNGGSPIIETFFGSPNPLQVDGTISLNWSVVNADKIYIKGMELYDDLPSVGTVSFPILKSDVSFGPEENLTTKKITLVASNNNKNSSTQVSEKTIIITVLRNRQADEPINILPPKITLFKATSYKVTPGDLVTLDWKTTNSEKTTLQNTTFDNTITKIPANGSLTVVIPQDIVIPSNGNGVTLTYRLAAENDNGIKSQNEGSIIQTDVRTLNIVVSKQLDPNNPITDPTDPNDPTIDPNDPTIDPNNPITDPTDPNNPITDPTDPNNPTIDPNNPTVDPTDPPSVIIEDPTNPTDPGSSDTTQPGTGDTVAIISDVDIISTGIGYTGGDTVVMSDGDSGEFNVDVNPLGQIVAFNILETGYGYTTIPNISIISKSGAGAEFRARLKFIPLNIFLKNENDKLVDPNKLVQVIDCVGKTRPNIGYVNGDAYSGPFHYHPDTKRKMVGAVHTIQSHQIIYDTVLESLENIQRVVGSTSASYTNSNTSSSTSSPSSTNSNTSSSTSSPSSSDVSSSSGYSGY